MYRKRQKIEGAFCLLVRIDLILQTTMVQCLIISKAILDQLMFQISNAKEAKEQRYKDEKLKFIQ